ncbi:hypothetical protein BWR18_19010 [Tateyamaria omphalii]|uniref:Uncharacterized protein n=1 Tax=Tateyamaria omphalii TaxID=299262 RepID=A0A1P8N056_9RHOB|nr:hypothetical protein BWR18_19010 [Tateyamaria omphalii]
MRRLIWLMRLRRAIWLTRLRRAIWLARLRRLIWLARLRRDAIYFFLTRGLSAPSSSPDRICKEKKGQGGFVAGGFSLACFLLHHAGR